MKKLLLLSGVCLLLALSACENKGTYTPSKYPTTTENRNTFSIPYQEKGKAMTVRVRLNGGPQFDGIWDTGCSLPMKITQLEAQQLIKGGTLSKSDYIENHSVVSANGQVNTYNVYRLKSVSFADIKGEEHVINDVDAVIDDNIETEILIGLPVMQRLGNTHEVSQYDNQIIFK